MLASRLLVHTLSLLLLIVHTFQHNCIHDTLESDIQINDPSNSMYTEPEGRVLQSYQNIQLVLDDSTLTGVSDTFRQYILESLMPPVQNIIQAALTVPSRSSNLKTRGISSICSGTIALPSVYSSPGVAADLVIFVTAVNAPSANYVANAVSCVLDSTTQRPIMGRIAYNLAQVVPTTNDAKREKDILVSLHEITHVLGFSNSLFKYYINPATNRALTGHYYTKTVLGMTTTVLNVAPLTQRLQTYFNCPTLEGAYMENQGGSGSVGSHFERRILYNEYMSASAIIDTRITQFTLALLEGTGWYQPNYDMADPITWGKNEGCAFYQGSCMNTATKQPNFQEFCSPLTQNLCSWTKRAGGACGAYSIATDTTIPSAMNWWGNYTASQDAYSDNCPIVLPYNNVDCEDTDNQDGSTLGVESYGYGSKCFMGTLYPRKGLSTAYPFCFKPTCQKTAAGTYYVQIAVGSQIVNCYQQQQVSVSGYAGYLSCPNPNQFCGQIMNEGFCRRGCSGRGSCVNRECVCQDGWGGYDCSKPTYDDNCALCADNSNPLTTSCFMDTCACNPANVTCMCPDGTQNMTSCVQSVIDYINSLNTHKEITTVSPVQEKNGLSTETIIAIVCGSIGGLLAIGGGYFGIRYVKRRNQQAKNAIQEIRPKVPKLELQFQHTEQNSQESPDLSRKAMSVRSVQDSPLMRHDSPLKERAYAPSRFKTFSSHSQVHPGSNRENHENQEVNKDCEIRVTPIESINKFHELEEPKLEDIAGVEANSPELKFEERLGDKAQNYIVPNV